MPQQLIDPDITRVSLVDKGANGRSIALLKRLGEPGGPEDLARLWDATNAAEPRVARQGLLEVIKRALGMGGEDPVAKSQTFAALIAGEQLTDALYDSWYTLESALWSAIWATDEGGADLSIEAKQALVAQNLDEFKAWLLAAMSDATAIAKRDVPAMTRHIEALVRKHGREAEPARLERLTKAAAELAAAIAEPDGSQDSDTGDDAQEVPMTSEELAQITKAVTDGIAAGIEQAVAKSAQPPAPPAPEPAQPVAKSEGEGEVSDAVAELFLALSKRLDSIEGAQTVRKSLDGQDGGTAPKAKSPLVGILN